MPTIDELAPATATADTDELLVSQGGIARKATRAQVLSGVQPTVSLNSGSLLGRQSAGTGGPEQIGIGANLTLSGGTLSAAASAFTIASLPVGNVPGTIDDIPIGQAGTNVAVTYSQFMSGISGLSNVNASQLMVIPTGSTVQQKLADFAAGALPKSGGALTGSLTLAADPAAALQAATKQYVDARVLRTGDTLTGPLTLAADPSLPLQAATKEYVDTQTGGSLPKTGGALTGALTLAADPAAALQAATKQYVDTRVLRTGDTLTGPLTLAADPTQPLQAATKEYVDNQAGANLSKAGGTLTGALTLATDPMMPLQAATKEYVDTQAGANLSKAGGTLTGALTLAADPTVVLQAATKQYVDTRVLRTGDTLTGPLTLAADPTQPLQAATKEYVDNQAGGSLPKAGGTLTGALTLAANPTSSLQAATKQYVDQQVATTLPLVGGTLTGPINLSANPTSALQAAPKQYVDAAVAGVLPISGGSMTGPLSFNQAYTGSAAPTVLTTSRQQANVGDSPLVYSTMTVAMSGGAGSSNTNALLTTNVGNVLNSSGVASDGPGTEVYSLVSYLNSSALRPLGVGAVAAQHVSIQSAPTRNLPPGGVPSGRQMAQLWALWLPTVDKTNLPSSVANSITANESDLQANNVDDANARFGLQLVVNEAIPLASGGYPLEWAYGILTTTSGTGQFKWMANLQGNYSIAVIDTRNAFPNGTALAYPTITTSLTSPSTTVHVSNAMPFTSAGVYGHPVSSTNTSSIKIGAGTYTQVGCSLDGPGLTSGTLTLAAAVSVANGVSGNVVTNTSRTIWMATGQQIAFDYGGTINVFYDTSVGSLHVTSQLMADGGFLLDHGSGTSLYWDSSAFSSAGGGHLQGNLMVTGTLYTPNSLTVGGYSTLAGPVTFANSATFNNLSTFQNGVTMNGGLSVASGTLSAKNGLSVSGGNLTIPIFTIATLPTAASGTLAYVSNGRKVGEASGSGTGVLAVGSSAGQWISVMSGTVVSA